MPSRVSLSDGHTAELLRGWAIHAAILAQDILLCVRPDLDQQQSGWFLKHHREVLRLGVCSFGRRGRPSYAVHCEADADRLLHVAGASGVSRSHSHVLPLPSFFAADYTWAHAVQHHASIAHFLCWCLRAMAVTVVQRTWSPPSGVLTSDRRSGAVHMPPSTLSQLPHHALHRLRRSWAALTVLVRSNGRGGCCVPWKCCIDAWPLFERAWPTLTCYSVRITPDCRRHCGGSSSTCWGAVGRCQQCRRISCPRCW